MSRRARGLASDWLLLAGAAGLLGSLFLTWSHQYSRSDLSLPGVHAALAGVPPDATAWQVYSAVDVLLAALAFAIAVCALVGRRLMKRIVLVAALGALAVCAHALAVPPTNGVGIVLRGSGPPHALSLAASSGAGETVGLAALAVSLAGLALARSAD